MQKLREDKISADEDEGSGEAKEQDKISADSKDEEGSGPMKWVLRDDEDLCYLTEHLHGQVLRGLVDARGGTT